ncbi:hypothetical protein ACFWBR_05760 [Streptomyces sp. NPDC060006]|uniref:hypothetical protein n=1 Tax=unclassified Streptomyces TaxID=2593676 RepID=UPI00368A986B
MRHTFPVINDDTGGAYKDSEAAAAAYGAYRNSLKKRQATREMREVSVGSIGERRAARRGTLKAAQKDAQVDVEILVGTTVLIVNAVGGAKYTSDDRARGFARMLVERSQRAQAEAARQRV